MSATDRTERHTTKLEMAHVLFMDIVGYSKLPMDIQEQQLMQLQDSVRQTAEFARAQADDQLIRLPTGDGMALVFFGDAEAPVRCAVELGRSLRKHSALELRMGIHTGPVYRVADINANRNVAGGGINIAQRVMDCGDAGHILVSGAEAEVLAQLSAWSAMLHDLGEVEVKHGVRIRLHNLYTNEAGNSELPKKVASSKPAAIEVGLKHTRTSARLRLLAMTGATMLVLTLAGVGWLFFSRKAHTLTDKDTIVLADFTNTTDDSVFDGTLRQALSVQLEQSPFLSIIPDQQIQQTLQMMGQKPDVKLTLEIARELCQRTLSAAALGGSIAQVGTQYLLTLKAVNCVSGKSIASTQVQASDKNHVLDALGKTASEIRNKLGESLSTLQKFDTPIEQATTSSLEAFQALSLGSKRGGEGDSAAAVPFFERAIKLDPNFAAAYGELGITYGNLGERSLASDNTRKAFELRGRVSEFEKLEIEGEYYLNATGNLEKARQAYELWGQTYPRATVPPVNLCAIFFSLGRYDEALEKAREALPLDPRGLNYGNLASSYIYLNRLEEARATAEEAQAKNLDSPHLRLILYTLAFLRNDASGMDQEVTWAAGKPGIEDVMLANEAYTAAYSGRLMKAREFSRQATASAERVGEKETAAGYEASAALWDALFGNASEAKQRVRVALGLSTGRDVMYETALSLALAGEAAGAQALVDDLAKGFPEDTIVQFNYLPTLRAQLALSRNDTSKAIEVLQAAGPYELGTAGTLYPIYMRGQAYLAAHQGGDATAEFQKILSHRGIVGNDPIGALVHLQIGRAYAMQGDTAKARAAYNNFITLWKDADPDIPILIAAKAEYAKLQ